MLKGLPVVPLFCSKNYLNDFTFILLYILFKICLECKKWAKNKNMNFLKRKRDKYFSMINGDETGRFVEKQRWVKD